MSESGPNVSGNPADMIGQVIREFVSDPVSLHHIREYLVGVGASTAHFPRGDDAAAIATVIAPPLFFLSACRQVVGEDELGEDGQHLSLGVPGIEGRSVVGGSTTEFLGEVRVGDVLFAEERIADVKERQGKSGPLVFVETETSYRNQRDEPVAIYRMTVVFR